MGRIPRTIQHLPFHYLATNVELNYKVFNHKQYFIKDSETSTEKTHGIKNDHKRPDFV